MDKKKRVHGFLGITTMLLQTPMKEHTSRKKRFDWFL